MSRQHGMRAFRSKALAGASALALSVVCGPAWAQEPASAQSTLGEVVVTAQKRAQRLQEVPLSMEVVSGDTIQDLAVDDFKEMVRYTPNVQVQTTAGNNVIYIRGFGSPPSNFAFDQAVSLYMDGIYAGRNRQVQGAFFDLARVEVIRGPQGALFGKNTPAGAVSIVSAGPTQAFEGAARALYNFQLEGFDVAGHVSGPISETLGARLAVKFTDQEGYIENLANDRMEPETQQALARLTLRYAPIDVLDYTLKVEYADQRVRGGRNVISPLNSAQRPGDERFSTQNPLGEEGSKVTSWLVSAAGNLSLGDFVLQSITGYSFFRSNIVNNFDQALPGGGSTRNSVYNSYPEHFRQWSQEVRLLSPTGQKLEYVVGAYYDTALYQLMQLGGFDVAIPGVLTYFGLLETNFRQRSETMSVFGQATYHVNDDLRLIGSARYTVNDKRGHFNGRLRYGPFALRPVNTIANGEIDGEDNFDPSVTVQYDVAPQIMVYATYGRGSKSGGFVSNTYGTTDATFMYQPEKSENYEVGLKSTLADGRVVLNLAAYDTSFKNLQVSVYNPVRQTYFTTNAAEASSRGVEGTFAYYPTRNLDFTLAAAYQDVQYDDYPGAACLVTQPISECNPADPSSIAANNLAGYSPAYASKWTGSLQVHHRAEFANDRVIDTTFAASGRSKFFNSDDQSPLYGLQKAYVKIDARIQYGPDDERWHVALVGKNLTNEKTTGSSFRLPFPITAVPRAILYLDETRNVAIEAGVRF